MGVPGQSEEQQQQQQQQQRQRQRQQQQQQQQQPCTYQGRVKMKHIAKSLRSWQYGSGSTCPHTVQCQHWSRLWHCHLCLLASLVRARKMIEDTLGMPQPSGNKSFAMALLDTTSPSSLCPLAYPRPSPPPPSSLHSAYPLPPPPSPPPPARLLSGFGSAPSCRSLRRRCSSSASRSASR